MMDNFDLHIMVYGSGEIETSKSMQYNLKDVIVAFYMQVIFCGT